MYVLFYDLDAATMLNLLLSRTSTDEMGSKVEWDASVTWILNLNEMEGSTSSLPKTTMSSVQKSWDVLIEF